MPGGRVGIIVQARMGSTRLPGKVLLPLGGKPVIQHVLERLMSVRASQTLVLTTSDKPADTPLVDFARNLGVKTFRGSEADVLDRYYRCAQAYDLAHVVRATGDNPFVDPEECERLIRFYLEKNLSYAAGFSALGCNLPIGIGVEIMSFAALETSWREGTAPHHREHVNEFILENLSRFRSAAPPCSPDKAGPELSFTIDTQEDLDRATQLFARHAKSCPSGEIGTEWLVRAAQAVAPSSGRAG